MNIRINGEDKEFGGGTLLALVASRGLVPDNIVIEHNREVVPKEKWDQTRVNESDIIEIIRFMGGG